MTVMVYGLDHLSSSLLPSKPLFVSYTGVYLLNRLLQPFWSEACTWTRKMCSTTCTMGMLAWHHILLFLAQKDASETSEAILTGANVLDSGSFLHSYNVACMLGAMYYCLSINCSFKLWSAYILIKCFWRWLLWQVPNKMRHFLAYLSPHFNSRAVPVFLASPKAVSDESVCIRILYRSISRAKLALGVHCSDSLYVRAFTSVIYICQTVSQPDRQVWRYFSMFLHCCWNACKRSVIPNVPFTRL